MTSVVLIINYRLFKIKGPATLVLRHLLYCLLLVRTAVDNLKYSSHLANVNMYNYCLSYNYDIITVMTSHVVVIKLKILKFLSHLLRLLLITACSQRFS